MRKLEKELELVNWVRKPKIIKFRSWFKGIIKGFNIDGETEFTVIFKLKPVCSAQQKWIIARLPIWVLIVNELSGATVISTDTFFEDVVDRRVEVKMKIKGALNSEKLDSQTGKTLGLCLKERLAQHILDYFPLLPGGSHICFAANHNVEFKISINPTSLKILEKSDVIYLSGLTEGRFKELSDRFKVNFISLSSSFLRQTENETNISMIFHEDTLPGQVGKLKEEVVRLLNDERLSVGIK